MNKLLFIAIGLWIVICGLAYGQDDAGPVPKVGRSVGGECGVISEPCTPRSPLTIEYRQE